MSCLDEELKSMTNSGRMQEEAMAPCPLEPCPGYVLSTEISVAVSVGFVQVVGTEKGNTRKDDNEIGTVKKVTKDAPSWRWYRCRKNHENIKKR
jgi:UDP-N-acetylglucosamine 2-epimerase